jgi:hypothetical protein
MKFGTSGLHGLVTDLQGHASALCATAFARHLLGSGLAKPGDRIFVAGDFRSSSPDIAATCIGALGTPLRGDLLGLIVARFLIVAPVTSNSGIEGGGLSRYPRQGWLIANFRLPVATANRLKSFAVETSSALMAHLRSSPESLSAFLAPLRDVESVSVSRLPAARLFTCVRPATRRKCAVTLKPKTKRLLPCSSIKASPLFVTGPRCSDLIAY